MFAKHAAAMLAIAIGLGFVAPRAGLAQKYGGVLRVINDIDPPSLSIHEEATWGTSWPMSPVYSNLVYYDPSERLERFETIRPELAESWRWSEDGTALTFTLRQGMRWHDGTPVTSRDVKHTWDAVREVDGKKFKLNPRKLWYFNVAEIVTSGDREVTFRLKRPQPSMVAMLAAGYSPVYPAHVDPRELRTRAVGTGPFRLKQYEAGKVVLVERNKDYFISGRPYLDAIQFLIIKNRATQTAAMLANQAEIAGPGNTPRTIYESLRDANVGIAFIESITNTTSNIIVNFKKPPFNDARLRKAVSLAMDRDGLIRSVYKGGAVKGGALIPAPYGLWGLTPEQLARLPGYGDPEKNKAEARKILAELGYNEQNPLRLKVSTPNRPLYQDPAVWVLGELKAVGIQADLEVVESGIWFSRVARRDFVFGSNATAVGIDDPDAALYENYKCGSQRNYTDFCDQDLERLYDQQSMETDFARRRAMVHRIDARIQELGARPMLIYRLDWYAYWPYVKNFVPHQGVYNFGRFQDVWLDK
ncbi:MAG: ABC transporter substrate-binding protein [Candidatus Lambdaproteobacteria bacterium]|nr:ABC transporter substrate-binding protein [Candidatus Lambdaproteobacteria bacterium]